MNGYQTNQWQRFRQEIIELDGGQCSQCGRDQAEVILQVHHKIYRPGRAPWQYHYQDCETLCKGCHAAEHGKIPPKSGWRYLGYEDLGDVSANCELCGSHFRYQFFIYHRDWGSMRVGSYCCNALTGTELASAQVDEQTRLDERRQRFIHSKRWIKTGGREIIRQKDIRIEIARVDGCYSLQLNHYPGQHRYASLEAAKSQVFDILEDGRAQAFIKRADQA